MSQARVIKKYPNRRLYDSKEGRYITLNDVQQLVLDGKLFEVVEYKTGDSITNSILLQVIVDLAQEGKPLISEELLVKLIRAHNETGPVGVNRSQDLAY